MSFDHSITGASALLELLNTASLDVFAKFYVVDWATKKQRSTAVRAATVQLLPRIWLFECVGSFLTLQFPPTLALLAPEDRKESRKRLCLQVKAAPAKPAAPKAEEPKGPPDLYASTLRSAGSTTAGLAGVLTLGFVSPSAAFSSMFTKFGLASICGYQVGSPPFSLRIIPPLAKKGFSVSPGEKGLLFKGSFSAIGEWRASSARTPGGKDCLSCVISCCNATLQYSISWLK